MNDRIVGYHTTLDIQTNQIEAKPALWPKASFTHVYIPPFSGQPVANSAETRETGIRKKNAEMSIKDKEENPYSALKGQFRILRIVEIQIPVKRSILSGFVF